MSRIVLVAWKDILNPAAGGAELLHHELSKRFVRDGHEVIHLVPGFSGCVKEEQADGIRIVRVGKGVLSFPRLRRVFRQTLRDQTDWLIDVFNCVGSGCCMDLPPDRTFLLIHHVQGRMWFYQTTFPGVPRGFMPLINLGGGLVERGNLWALSRCFKGPVLAVSESTASELVSCGFRRDRIRLISEGIAGQPLSTLGESLPKAERFSVLMIGPRKSKRPMHSLDAFAKFHEECPETELVIAGWGTELEPLRKRARRLRIESHVHFPGRVTEEEKKVLLQRAHVLITTPVKEGWGIIVVEANAMGTPVIGYRVPGIRDALRFGNGFLCDENPGAMARELATVYHLWKTRPTEYETLRQKALDASRPITFDTTFAQLEGWMRAGNSGPE